MKIKYLGTGAAEGIPAVFCHCGICEYARKQKGKEIRTRSQAIIDDLILIDFGPDTFAHTLRYDIELANIYECLITHAHDDHLYLEDLRARRKSRAILKEGTPILNVYGGEGVKNVLLPDNEGFVTKNKNVKFHKVKAFKTFDINNSYKITALPAVHGTQEPFVYIIRKGRKTFLYAHDTDVFKDEVWEYFCDNNIIFDAISLDCTEGIKHIDYPGHMNFERMKIMCEKMNQIESIRPETVIIASHISHNGQISFKDAEELGKRLGYIVAYDGMTLQI